MTNHKLDVDALRTELRKAMKWYKSASMLAEREYSVNDRDDTDEIRAILFENRLHLKTLANIYFCSAKDTRYTVSRLTRWLDRLGKSEAK